ncbi:MAG TPA: hypothetical protein VKE96_12490 [Vicinamibacterales bacterium]|nr:hypothetical protein [Vicinamibacterales bacterium]
MSTRHLSATDQRDAARRNRYEIIHERNLLLALLTRIYPSHLAPTRATTARPRPLTDGSIVQEAPQASRDYDQMRFVVCVHTPLRILAWKISVEEREEVFGHLAETEDDWVPHTKEEKIDTLEALVAQLAARPATDYLTGAALPGLGSLALPQPSNDADTRYADLLRESEERSAELQRLAAELERLRAARTPATSPKRRKTSARRKGRTPA